MEGQTGGEKDRWRTDRQVHTVSKTDSQMDKEINRRRMG